MIDRRKALSLVSSRNRYHKFSPLQISDALRVGFEAAQNLRSAFVEWDSAVMITNTPQRNNIGNIYLF